MGLTALLTKLGQDNGIEIDPDELEAIGLSDDGDEAEAAAPSGRDEAESNVLSIPLPGRAAGRIELFLAADSTAKVPVQESDGLMWYPIIREGQWALRPGGQTGKRKTPLKVVAGTSTNQRKYLGLQDLVDAFNDEAIQHVTVPSSHSNTVLENQGYITGMKIVDGTVKDQKTKKPKKVKVLMGGYDITEPETKGKMERRSIANRSAGILYDYTNTETGKTYPAVIEHVALTNKPWITGMVSFGRKLKDGTADVEVQTVGLSLSDEGPTDDEYVVFLADDAKLDDTEMDFLADATSGATWEKQDSPNWLKCQTQRILDKARSEKTAKIRGNAGSYVDYSYPPSYRCCEAKPGTALISDGWGDDANFWSAPISVVDGAVELAEFDKWAALAKAFVPDDRPAPDADDLPLDEEGKPGGGDLPVSRIKLAQVARKARAERGQTDTNDHPRGGGNMAGTATEDAPTGALELSETAQRAIQAAEDRAKAAEKANEELSEKLNKLAGTVNSNEVDTYLNWVKSEEGLGLSEERGFAGFLTELRQQMLADDGEPALVGEHFAQDGNTEGEISFSQGVKRLFAAIKTSTEGKKALGDVLSEPTEEVVPAKDKDGKPVGDGADGKPPAAETDEETLADTEKSPIELLSEKDDVFLEGMKLGADKLQEIKDFRASKKASESTTDKGGAS